MAIRNIVQVGDETLRKKSFEVVAFDQKLHTLLDDMRDTVKKAHGAGLAAPQVGVLRRVFVVDVDEGFFEFVNPVIVSTSGSQDGKEGCLSVKGKFGDVVRPNKVVIKAQDRFGNKFSLTAKEFFARAICHEYDHLDGVLYIDKARNIEEE
ncbi:MAG: peptide deformylase [Clostridia bacterium]|nr:peptide deformylase [Clostridia bacterium]